MKLMRNFWLKCIKYLPEHLQGQIYRFGFFLRNTKLLSAFDQYKYSDEHLKFVHIIEAINYMRVAGAAGGVPQTYFEFGCHSGRTFSSAVNAANFLKMPNVLFYAFDSFKGLPFTSSENDGYFTKGTYCTSRSEFLRIVERKTGLLLDDRNVVQGYYCDSLNTELQNRMPKAGVVHIDVDLYSSTVDVLRFLKPLLVQGTLLIFDDWFSFPAGSNMGERRALMEFLEEYSEFEIEPWKAYSTFGQSFFISKAPQS